MVSTKPKISPAFEPFLAESGPNDKRDAIVIYQAPASKKLRVRGRPQELQVRLDQVKEQAAIQEPVEQRIFEGYQRAGGERLRGDQELAVSTIGSRALPVASVEVTRRTLPALAEQPDVVAVLPNQKIRLIQPTHVGYADIRRQELRSGLTWGAWFRTPGC